MQNKESQLSDIQQEAIRIVREEVEAYEDAEVFVTDRVSFACRDLVRTLRKNYWGIFDVPVDPITGRKRIFVPLPRMIASTADKFTRINTRDMNFRAKHRKGVPITNVIRGYARDWFDRTFFGMALNQSNIMKCIDGMRVWKIVRFVGSDGKIQAKRSTVELLNCYIDPSADSIQATSRFTERALLSRTQMEAMTGWDNTKSVSYTEGLSRTDPKTGLTGFSTVKQAEVFELWGDIPRWLVTGDEKDKKSEEVVKNGHIVVSGVRRGERAQVHLIEQHNLKDKDGNYVKPYEEDWYTKIEGRWYGVGPVEMVLMLTLWVNTIVNIRINRNNLAQLGLFKYRQNSGITKEILKRLPSNGSIKVRNMDDIEQFVIQEAGVGSYKDEEVAVDWAQRVTSATELLSGEKLPASAPATSTVLQDTNSKTTFADVQEDAGIFLQRVVDRHLLPVWAKQIKKKQNIRIAGDFENIRALRERIAANILSEELDRIEAQAVSLEDMPTNEEIMRAYNRTIEKLEDDEDLFLENLEEIIAKDYDTQFYVTNEEFNQMVVVDRLIQTLQVAPEIRDIIAPEILDKLGISLPSIVRQRMQKPPTQEEENKKAVPSDLTFQDAQELTTSANVINA